MTTQFTIKPRYADKAGTIPAKTYRNVFAENDAYVGCVVIHDGKWTPLYRTEDLDNPVVVDVLQRAADQMNSAEDAR